MRVNQLHQRQEKTIRKGALRRLNSEEVENAFRSDCRIEYEPGPLKPIKGIQVLAMLYHTKEYVEVA